eukprot:TRINITY_DN12906_c0_g1_i1.p1 TRINITY_DN12906_c0_g1~~TRINITY_DN12906_c0_g1_i1.p1  ORF type:complete len:370 (-),score=44.03 TRINITY_DN12906_c0_g1_i1:326-1435(-)
MAAPELGDELVAGPSEGDPYRDWGDVVRGVTLDDSAFDDQVIASYQKKHPKSPEPCVDLSNCGLVEQVECTCMTEFSLTSVCLGIVSQMMAFDILQKYFNTREYASITKLRAAKGWLMVKAWHDSGHRAAHCVFKIRVVPPCPSCTKAGVQPGLVAVFQRREGDSTAFMHILRRAKSYIQYHCGLAPATTQQLDCFDGPSLPLGEMSAADMVTAEEIQPVIDMMHSMQQESIQLEALNALAIYLKCRQQTPELIRFLRSHETVLLKQLVKTAFEFSCPAAHVAAALPAEHFSSTFAMNLLQTALNILRADLANEKVKAGWAMVLRNVMATFASNHDVVNPAELLPALADAIQKLSAPGGFCPHSHSVPP